MKATKAPTPIQAVTIYWVDVRDHLPDDETSVLVWAVDDDGDADVYKAWHEENIWRDAGSAQALVGVTHWADLPDGPGNKQADTLRRASND